MERITYKYQALPGSVTHHHLGDQCGCPVLILHYPETVGVDLTQMNTVVVSLVVL